MYRMDNEAAYCCAGFLFLVLIVLFAVSMRTNSRTHKYCQFHKKNESAEHAAAEVGHETHPNRAAACIAVRNYCKMSRCHKKKHHSSSEYVKRACGLTRKICKHTTCKQSASKGPHEHSASGDVAGSHGTHPNRALACKAAREYCEMSRCHDPQHRASSEYVKRACGFTRKMCKHCTCKQSVNKGPHVHSASEDVADSYGTHPNRALVCKAAREYCEMSRCHDPQYRASSEYVKRACGFTRKMCKHTTCKLCEEKH